MMDNYIVLVKEGENLNLKFMGGNFRDFLNECKSKIYLKIKIPKIFVLKKN